LSVVGDNIKQRRESLGLSQVDLADAIGETKQTIWKYESGTVTNIPLPKVEAIAKALSCTPNELTGWDSQQPSKPLTPEQAKVEEQLSEIREILFSLPPELRTHVLAVVKGLVPPVQSQDDRGGSQ